MKRKSNADERRRVLCDAAIEVLAHDGARGLTHRNVEQRAGLPAGTTSSYFRTREALLHGAAQRIAELDAADFDSAVNRRRDGDGDTAPATLSVLAQMVKIASRGSALTRSRARYELALHTHRDEVLRRMFAESIAAIKALSEVAVRQSQPDGYHDPALIEEQAYAVTTYLNGTIVRQVIDDSTAVSVEDLTRQLHALLTGIAASHQLPVDGGRIATEMDGQRSRRK